MATIDDLNSEATVRATVEEVDNGPELVASARFVVTIPRDLLTTIAGGTTRSQVMVRDWLKPAIEALD